MSQRVCVAVTRPAEEGDPLSVALETAGVEVLKAPLIEILPVPDPGVFQSALADLTQQEIAVFTSRHSVEAVMRGLGDLGGDPSVIFNNCLIAAVGKRTGEALRRHGLTVNVSPDRSDAESLGEALTLHRNLKDVRVFLPLGDRARRVLPDALRDAGANLTEVVVYLTRSSGDEAALRLEAALLNDSVDVVTFSSGSAVEALMGALGRTRAVDCLSRSALVALGKTAVDALESVGLAPAAVAANHDSRSLADAVLSVVAREDGADS